jgi:hypothetical protein
VLNRFPALEVGKDLHVADEAGRTGSDVLDNGWIGLLGMLRLKRQLMIRWAANPLRIWKSFRKIGFCEAEKFVLGNFCSPSNPHRFLAAFAASPPKPAKAPELNSIVLKRWSIQIGSHEHITLIVCGLIVCSSQ